MGSTLLIHTHTGSVSEAVIISYEAIVHRDLYRTTLSGVNSTKNMEKRRVIGTDVHYTYEEDNRINVEEPTDSVLYRAELTEPGRFGVISLVAIKKFRIDSCTKEAAQISNSDLLMRWENLTKLRHENVVSYHTFAIQWMHPDLNTGLTFVELDVVMDYCDGSTLHAMTEEMFESKRTLHVKTLFDFSKQMANALAYLHENNIVHGVLTPRNVLINKSAMGHFRLRLCGLDNFTSSYAAFVFHSAYFSVWLAPEVLMILREAVSVVLDDDPCFSALHIVQKLTAMEGFILFPWTQRMTIDTEKLMEDIVNTYTSYSVNHRLSAGELSPNERLAEYLHCIPAAAFRSNASHSGKQALSQFMYFLEEVCISNSSRAQEIFANVLKHMGHVTAFPKEPDDILDNVMSFYFQRIRAPSTSELAAETRSFLRSRLLSVPSARFDGRKADVWSLGRIMESLSSNTFDTSQKLKDEVDSPDNVRTFMMRTFGTEQYVSYINNFVPTDFLCISNSCLNQSVKKRLTAKELVDKLVALEEHTYGSTWVYKSQAEVADEEVPETHRQMVEEIGCECKYDYSFPQDFIGEGANGYVYKAKITRFGSYKGNETVAIKEITLTNAKIKQMQQDYIWGEAKEQWRKLISLSHPHLVTYHKFSIWKILQGASIEIVMDYCEGGDLDKLLTECRTGVCSLSIEAVVNYALQLASGVSFLHENQFVHADLKPSNVFMSRATGDTGNRTLRIGDVDGAVRIHTDSSKPKRTDLAGTGPYMSPEMVMLTLQQEHEDVGFPTDMWSVGCVILDLANCSAGIKERMFHKMVVNAEGILEICKIQPKSLSANAFLLKLAQGFHPFVSELINQEIRDAVQRCLMPACKDRATAALVLEHLGCEKNGDPYVKQIDDNN